MGHTENIRYPIVLCGLESTSRLGIWHLSPAKVGRYIPVSDFQLLKRPWYYPPSPLHRHPEDKTQLPYFGRETILALDLSQ